MTTNKDFFRQLEEFTLENGKLKSENRLLRGYKAEAISLRAEKDDLKKFIDKKIEEGIERAIFKAVEKATAPLLKKISEQEKEILRLKAQIDKDSTNSGKPPSTNGFKKLPNNRTPSERKQGGQHGHKGSRLNIPDNLDELKATGKIEHHIIYDGVSENEPFISDFTIDLKVLPVYIETRRPVGAPPQISYGDEFRVYVVYLSIVGLIPVQRLMEITHGMITVSNATIAKVISEAAKKTDQTSSIQDLLNGGVINVDDTSIKTTERPNESGVLETSKNTTFTAYIRTYSNLTTTVLVASPRKSEESVKCDNILTQFQGILSHDHEAKFFNFGDKHASCGGHLSRELKGMAELNLLDWAAEFRAFYVGINNHKNEDLSNGVNICDPAVLCQFECQYDELVKKGIDLLGEMDVKSFGYAELTRMTNRLSKHKDSYMLFIRDYTAPFTNNLAERDLRHSKTKQKISGCFRTWQGLVDYCSIRSLLGTAKKRNQNLIETLRLLIAQPFPAGQ